MFGRQAPAASQPHTPLHVMRVLSLIALAVSLSGSLTGAETARELETLTGQWLQLQQSQQQLETAWEQEHQLLQAERDLLLREQEALLEAQQAKTIERVRQRDASAEAQASYERLQAKRQVIADQVTAAEGQLQTLIDSLPETFRGEFAAIPDGNLAQRLKALQGNYETLARLAFNLREGSIILETPDGQRRELQVLYIGVHSGFAVDGAGRWAAVGRLEQAATTGVAPWRWTFGDVQPDQVLTALAIYRGEASASFIDLPLQVREASP